MQAITHSGSGERKTKIVRQFSFHIPASMSNSSQMKIDDAATKTDATLTDPMA